MSATMSSEATQHARHLVPTAQMLFASDVREELSEEPTRSLSDVSKVIGERWLELTTVSNWSNICCVKSVELVLVHLHLLNSHKRSNKYDSWVR